jgi:hypothetical protein
MEPKKNKIIHHEYLTIKKAARWLNLAAFVVAYGGAGGI